MDFNLNSGVPEKIFSMMQDGTLERYGSYLVNGAGKIAGHFEQVQLNKLNAKNRPFEILGNIANTLNDPDSSLSQNIGRVTGLVASGSVPGTGKVSAISSIVTNVQNQKMISQLNGISAQLGSLASLGWANMALSAVNIGVTVASTVIICKKMDKLSAQMTDINNKLDSITQEIHQIYGMVKGLQDDRIRQLYTMVATDIQQMNSLITDLNQGDLDDYKHIKRTSKDQLINYSNRLNDLIGRFNGNDCTIKLSLDVIMAYFYAYTSFLKTYISVSYLHDKKLQSFEEYSSSLRSLCSSAMISSIDELYRNSTDSFISLGELNLIKSLYKGILAEQISGIKSQNKILELLPYNEYARINEQLLGMQNGNDIAFVEYRN